MNNRFYFDTEGNDDEAYKNAISFACDISKKDQKVGRLIFLVINKQTVGWLERIFGIRTIKNLFDGVKFNGYSFLCKIETLATYKTAQYKNYCDIVICCGLDSNDIFKIDDYSSIKYIIAIPWLKKNTEGWIKTWGAEDISGKPEDADKTFPEPTMIVKKAMSNLTASINMSTGISNPSDNNRAKTFVKALYKYEDDLNSDVVSSYLIRELHWTPRHAQDVKKLIDTLNQGKFFQGGEKVGLKEYYKKWKNDCEVV